ncbi:MAG: hypothetical protein A2015_03680 [Spirochaetes bacterium GWF1_31_7]|nr:MAG: hypothetical protein A2Y29_04910 [Spirochaetes bacterium GWE2_31_10]OHD53236.1 MAG: hypothetical protein A2015_03680 [Spirochaetes bacterium GWF1_31_7]HBD94733.1 hypothetical protein [Spirochaetia bacterium]HBI39061.1 hypothetical protein [Spirochaetia bacterium]
MNRLVKIPDKEYFDADGLSNSFLIRFDRSPAHAFTEMKQTDGMKVGSLFHTYILTPELFEKQYIIAPDDIPKDKRTVGYKEFAKDNPDKEILFKQDVEELIAIKEKIDAYTFEGNPLHHYLSQSEKEIALFWELYIDNKKVQCKGKADALYITGDTAILFDVKKVQNCLDFQKSVISYKYYRQANFYMTGLKALYPQLKSIRFIFITIEENYPNGILDFELDDDFIYEGEKENYRSILKYLNWNGNKNQLYDNHTVKIMKPDWLCA